MESRTTCSLIEAGRALGRGMTATREMARAGTLPGVIKLGNQNYRVSLFVLSDALGCSVDDLRVQLWGPDAHSESGEATAA